MDSIGLDEQQHFNQIEADMEKIKIPFLRPTRILLISQILVHNNILFNNTFTFNLRFNNKMDKHNEHEQHHPEFTPFQLNSLKLMLNINYE